MAETNYDSDGSLKKCGFDYVNDRLFLYDIKILKSADSSFIKKVINDPEISRYAHIIENHDEKRSLVTCSNNHEREHSAAIISLTLPEIRLFNQGQWCGYTGEIGVHLRRDINEKRNEEFIEFYNKLFDVLKLDALRNGKYSVNDVSCFSKSSEILSWKYELNGNFVAVFVNFSQEPIDNVYMFNGVAKSVTEVNDLFGDKGLIKLEKQNELKIHLDHFCANVFRNRDDVFF